MGNIVNFPSYNMEKKNIEKLDQYILQRIRKYGPSDNPITNPDYVIDGAHVILSVVDPAAANTVETDENVQ